jgi:DNA-binding XRE family transcriptional regulator
MAVVNNLRTIRMECKLNQEQLASNTGTGRESIVRYESGERTPSLETALRLSIYFHKPVEALFRLDDDSLAYIHEHNTL